MFRLLLYAILIAFQVFSIQANKNDQNKVRLQVFTTKDSVETIEISKNAFKTNSSLDVYCNKSSKLILITHGFAETWRMKTRWDWVESMKNEFFRLPDIKDLCIVALDWKELAAGGDIVPNYWKAIKNMDIAGDLVSDALNGSKFNIKNFHCIGFSLGAHMCSVLYKIYYKKFKVKPGRLTGLDPAGPFLREKNEEKKIAHTDADFVDVINTSNDLGLDEKSGHMNFFTNNEMSSEKTCKDVKYRYQLYDKVILYETESKGNKYEEVTLSDEDVKKKGGINKITIKDLLSNVKEFFKKVINLFRKLPKRVFVSAHQFFGCNHLLAVRYFIYSINDCVYQSQYCGKGVCKAVKNETFPRMGYFADRSDIKFKTSLSMFFVNTSSEVPFCYDSIPKRSNSSGRVTSFY